MANTVRKNFVFDAKIASHLEELANRDQKSMTAFLQEVIEERYEEIEVQKKIEALEAFAGSGTGLFGDLTIQDIKANWDV
jgi:predicted DNA-binding protein